MDLSRVFTSVSESARFAVVAVVIAVAVDFRPVLIDVFFVFPFANFRSFSESVSEISPSSKTPPPRYFFINASVDALDGRMEEEEVVLAPFFELANPGMTLASVEEEEEAVEIAEESEDVGGTETILETLFLAAPPFVVFAVPFFSPPLLPPPSLSVLTVAAAAS